MFVLIKNMFVLIKNQKVSKTVIFVLITLLLGGMTIMQEKKIKNLENENLTLLNEIFPLGNIKDLSTEEILNMTKNLELNKQRFNDNVNTLQSTISNIKFQELLNMKSNSKELNEPLIIAVNKQLITHYKRNAILLFLSYLTALMFGIVLCV